MAIEDAYRPRFSGDEIARSPLGKVLGLAERLDTLACGFAVGMKPTGNKDPLGYAAMRWDWQEQLLRVGSIWI